MKAILPHQFFLYARQFSLKSMIKSISLFAQQIFKDNNCNLFRFARRKSYSIQLGKKIFKGSVLLVQTWLIDIEKVS